MFAINFYEDPGEKIAKALRSRKGICENYMGRKSMFYIYNWFGVPSN